MRTERIHRARESRAARNRASADGLTAEQKIARARDNAGARAAALVPQPSLPEVGPEVELITVTKAELHDLIYTAASTCLRDSAPNLPNRDRQKYAERIASQGLLITQGQDYVHRGADPRA